MMDDSKPESLRWLQDADSAELRNYLQKELGDDRTKRIETEGYLHPYGFVVFKLGIIEPGWLIRLHIWPGGQDRAEGWRVHNHAWSLYSRVLTGKLINYQYIVQSVSRSSNVLYTVETSDFASGKSGLLSSGQYVQCTEAGAACWKKDDLYVVDKFAFHDTVVPNQEITATLVLTEIAGAQRPHVVGPSVSGGRISFKRQTLEPRSTLQLLADVVDR
jgi:hypothetical protein